MTVFDQIAKWLYANVTYKDWLWILIYVGIACAVYIFCESKAKSPFRLKSLISYCFPAKYYWTKSTRIDLFIFLLNTFLFSPIFFISWGIVLSLIHFDNQFAITANSLELKNIELSLNNFFIALIIFVLVDGVNAYQHYLSHRIPFLWEFHKVHHSAPGLNLLTNFRHHPVSFLIAIFLNQASVIILIYIFQMFLGADFNKVMVWAITNVIGEVLKPIDTLKHTHLWISFGWLSYIFQSPAMHQMHHSVEAKYHHKNFAGYFSFWDWFMGTLYIPVEHHDVAYGLKKPVWAGKRYDTFWGSIVDPFRTKK